MPKFFVAYGRDYEGDHCSLHIHHGCATVEAPDLLSALKKAALEHVWLADKFDSEAMAYAHIEELIEDTTWFIMSKDGKVASLMDDGAGDPDLANWIVVGESMLTVSLIALTYFIAGPYEH